MAGDVRSKDLADFLEADGEVSGFWGGRDATPASFEWHECFEDYFQPNQPAPPPGNGPI